MDAFSWPLAGHDRHTDAFSWAIPTSTTLPPPLSAAAAMSGRASSSFLSPFLKYTTGTSRSLAKRWTSLT
ncbi:MAG: hypothetical protein ACRDYY_15820 [Acidimicrobiales bacterium]